MRELPQSGLYQISGGITAKSTSLAAAAATSGYIASRLFVPTMLVDSEGPTVKGAAIAATSCSLATQGVWNSPRVAAAADPSIGYTVSFLCGALVGVGENFHDDMTKPYYLDPW